MLFMQFLVMIFLVWFPISACEPKKDIKNLRAKALIEFQAKTGKVVDVDTWDANWNAILRERIARSVAQQQAAQSSQSSAIPARVQAEQLPQKSAMSAHGAIVDHGRIELKDLGKYTQYLEQQEVGFETVFKASLSHRDICSFISAHENVIKNLVARYRDKGVNSLCKDLQFQRMNRKLLNQSGMPQEYVSQLIPVMGKKFAAIVFDLFKDA